MAQGTQSQGEAGSSVGPSSQNLTQILWAPEEVVPSSLPMAMPVPILPCNKYSQVCM